MISARCAATATRTRCRSSIRLSRGTSSTSGHGTSPGTRVVIWDCNGGSNQRWTLNADGTIVGVESSLCLDVTGAGTANGTLVEIWTCNGGGNQRWSRS